MVVERSEKSDVFANADGSRTARVYPRPVNFKDGSGSWRPIDANLVADGAGFRNGGGPLDVRFAGQADSSSLLRVASGATAASFSMESAGPMVPSTAGSSLRYSGVAPDVDLEYEVGATSVKELVVLRQAPSSPEDAIFRFRLNLEGLTPELRADGSIALRDAKGREELMIPAATAWDSAVDPGSAEPVYGPAGLGLARDDAGWVVTLTGDPAWLADPARRYPVYLDPTVAAGRDSGLEDAFVTSAYPTNNYNSAWSSTLNRFEDKVGYLDSTTGTNNTYLWYDFGFLDGADIVSATWNGYFIHSYYPTTPTRYRLRPTNCCWDAGTVTWNTQPTWRPEFVDGMGVKNEWATSDVTAWVSNWTSGGWGNDGLALDTAGDGIGSWKKLAAAENNDGSASYVQVTYNRPPAMAAVASAMPVDGTTVASLSPTLSVAPAADPDGNPVSYWFRVVTGADGETGTVVDSGLRSSPTWTVPAGSLVDGVAYTWRVYTFDGRVYTTPDWVRGLKVDLRVGERATNPTDSVGPVGVNLSNGNLSLATATPSMATAGGAVGLSFAYNSQTPTATGLTGSYSNDGNANRLFDDPVHLVRRDPQVNFNWGTGSPYPEVITGDNFLVRWTGFVTVPAGGAYSFGAAQDDGVRITVNNTLVLDRWAPQSGGPNYGTAVSLSAGVPVPIKVEYFEQAGGAAVSLYAKGPVAETIVPASWLSTAAPALPTGWSLSADLDGELTYARAVLADASAVLTDSSGATHTYAWNGASYLPPAGEYGVLTKRADGGVTLQEDTGTIYVFDTSGNVASATSGADDRGSPTYTWAGSPTRLQAIVDPVSGRTITLRYGGDPACPASAPAGFDPAAPAGMLCEARFPDATATRLWYVVGQLGRVEDPGGEVTDFAYAAGRLSKVRDPLAADAVAAGAAPNDDTTRTIVTYDAYGQAATVTLAAPSVGAARPARTYRFNTVEAQVDVAGLAQPAGFARKVTFDAKGRTLTDTDAGSRTTTTTWNTADQPTSTTDPAGRRSTTAYDLNGKPTRSYGPAPTSWFNPDGTPAAGRGPTAPEADQVPVTTTNYDEGTVGLSAEWWNTPTPGGGPPVASSLAFGRYLDGSFYNLYAGAPVPGVNADGWSVRMTGTVTFPAAGTYNVNPATMDGARVFVDGKLFADDWNGSGLSHWTTPLQSITVAAGEKHKIVLEAHDTTGDELIQLGFQLANLSPNLGLVTSTVDPDGNSSAVTYANPSIGLASATTQDPAGSKLATTAAYDTTRRRTAKRLPANTYPTAVAADGPWGQWRLADRGWTAADSSGNNRNGAYYSADLYGGPRRGAAGALVGEDDPAYANLGGYGQVDLPNDTIRGGAQGTIEAWIRPDAPGVIMGMVNATSVAYVPVLYVGTDNRLRGTIYGFPQLTSPGGVVGNGWHHVALTFSATTATLYLDGVAVGSTGGAANHLDMDRTYLGVAKTTGWPAAPVANPNGWTYYTGGIDDVAVYRTALPAVRVQAHQAMGGTDLSATTDAYYASTSDPIAVGNSCGGVAVVGLASRTAEVDPDGTGVQARMTRDTVYDSLGRVRGTRVNGGGWSCTTYDARGRTIYQTHPAYGIGVARAVIRSWSTDMLTTTTSDAAGTVTSRVDLLGRVVSSTDVWAKTTTTAYDQPGRPTTTVGPSGTLTTAYRTDGLTNTVSVDGTVVASPVWSSAGELDGVTYSSGVLGTFGRDVLGREASVSWSGPAGTITTDAVTRNRSGKIVNQTIDGVDPYPAGVNFAYDPAGRLVDAWTPGRRQTYGFGTATCGSVAAGRNTNRTAATDTAGAGVSYCYDVADRLTQVTGDTRYTGVIAYDDHGNTTTLGGSTLGYDSADRHLRTTTGATTVDYLRDATDRITRRNLNGAVVAKYAHCGTGDNPCATLDNAGTVLERVIGLPGGATLTKKAAGDTWALPNVHGDTATLTNATGAKQGATRTYDPFGQTTGGGIPDTLTGNLDYGWLGEYQRPVETQAGLQTIEMGARQYLPGLGRFIEIDPVEDGSANDYDYSNADPNNQVDLDGRHSECRKSSVCKMLVRNMCQSRCSSRYLRLLLNAKFQRFRFVSSWQKVNGRQFCSIGGRVGTCTKMTGIRYRFTDNVWYFQSGRTMVQSRNERQRRMQTDVCLFACTSRTWTTGWD